MSETGLWIVALVVLFIIGLGLWKGNGNNE
jgi:hypothetical protein